MSTAERTVQDVEKIRQLMIQLKADLDAASKTDVGRQVLAHPDIKAKIRHIAIHNTSSPYHLVKAWVTELNRFL